MLRKIKDPVSALSHLLGVFISIAGLVVLVVSAAIHATAWHVVSFAIFGASLILLYSASTVYHMFPVSEKMSIIFRKIDHIMIFILIAGTYTPICLVPLRGPWGWSLFGAIWGFAIAGIMLKLFWFKAPRWLSTVIYVIMGWLAIIAIVPLVKTLPGAAVFYIVLGGIFYSIGAVIYGTKRPNFGSKWFGFHELFHIFVLLGSIAHLWVMLRYVLYL